MAALTIDTVPLTDLRPHPDNPRNGDTDAIGESLAVNGQYQPIVVAKDGTVLVGKDRYAAALELGWESIDVVRLPLAPNSAKARRIMLADNRTSDLARYDDAQLLRVLSDLGDDKDGLAGTGFEQDDLENLERLVAALGVGTTAPRDEWLGLPSMGDGDRESAFRTVIHFPTMDDADRFFAKLDRPKARFFFWPNPDGHVGLVGSDGTRLTAEDDPAGGDPR